MCDMRSQQIHENISLTFVITHQVILNLTTDGNLLAVSAYVAYRMPFPDEKTVRDVKQELQKNKIDYNQLVDLPMTNCN